jgi:hypothetical protein
LAELAQRLPPGALLASRDTLRDVGTGATAAGEYERASPVHVAPVPASLSSRPAESVSQHPARDTASAPPVAARGTSRLRQRVEPTFGGIA